jgi:dihydroneopterin aldolase
MEMDEISLEGMVFFGRHGVNEEETRLGQRFGVDLTVWADLEKAATTDQVADTISYATLYKLVRDEVEGAPSKLLEHLAARILRAVLKSDQRIAKACVRVTKTQPPIKGSVTASASVVLERERGWREPSD